MNNTIYTAKIAGQIKDRERGLRVVVGIAAVVAILTGAMLSPVQIFAATMLCMYMGLTAAVGVDPVYAISEKLSGGTSKQRAPKTRAYVGYRHQAIPVSIRR